MTQWLLTNVLFKRYTEWNLDTPFLICCYSFLNFIFIFILFIKILY